MPALNFMPQFVDPIRAGTKHHTIRATRKVPVKRGDKLYLYCGMRHKGAFRILPEAQTCTKTYPIRIYIKFVASALTLISEEVFVGEDRLLPDELATLAQADGFPDWNQMRWFWMKTHGKNRRSMGSKLTIVDFKGQIIHWR